MPKPRAGSVLLRGGEWLTVTGEPEALYSPGYLGPIAFRLPTKWDRAKGASALVRAEEIVGVIHV